jgi:hypothetical protein
MNYQQRQNGRPMRSAFLFIPMLLAANVDGMDLLIRGLHSQRNYGLIGPGEPLGAKLALVEQF